MALPLCGWSQVQALDLYQYNYVTISPAFAGIEGTKITAVGNGIFYDGRATYSVFGGFETRIRNVGLGLTGSKFDSGLQSMFYINLPANYQWNIGENRKLIFGARLSYQEIGVDYSWYVAVDPNDPLLSGGTIASSFLNTGLGLLYKGDKFYTGFSVDNALHTDASIFEPVMMNQYNVIVGKDFGGEGKLASNHSIYAAWVDDNWRIDLNNAIVFNKKIIAGVSVQFTEDETYPKVNAGYRFGDIAQVVLMLYSKTNESESKDFSGQLFLQFKIGETDAE